MIRSRKLRSLFVVCLVGVPVTAGFDFGGVLDWTRYVASLTLLLLAAVYLFSLVVNRLFSTPTFRRFLTCSTERLRRGIRVGVGQPYSSGHRLPASNESDATRFQVGIPLSTFAALLVAGLCCFIQCIPMPPSAVERLSPASANAWNHWLEPVNGLSTVTADQGTVLAARTISIDRNSTLRRMSLIGLCCGFMCLGLAVIQNRSDIYVMLYAIAIGTAVHALCGILDIHPLNDVHRNLKGFHQSYAGFVNRSNAALHFATGAACGHGLATMIANDESVRCGQRSRWKVLDRIICRWDFWIATTAMMVCIVGIVLSGSRAALFAIALAFAVSTLVHTKSEIQMVGAVGLLVLFAVILVVTRMLGFELLGIDRLNAWNMKEEMGDSVRINHWQDSFRAALESLPLGSGGGAYATAYLPYQENGAAKTFEHADNLYLEALVEFGIVGIVSIALLSLGSILAVYRMKNASEPVDIGLSSTLCFAAVFVALTQLTDFGLLIPANALLLALLFSVCIGRSARLRVTQRKIGDGAYKTAAGYFGGLLCILFVAAFVPSLRNSAIAESLLESGKRDLDRGLNEPNALCNLGDRLADANANIRDRRLYDLESRVRFRAARLTELVAEEIQGTDDLSRALRKTKPGFRTAPVAVPSARKAYQQSVACAMRSLQQRPLAIAPRVSLFYGSVADADSELRFTLLRQLASLQTRNPQALLKIGRLLCHQGQYEEASSVFNRATAINSGIATQVLAAGQQWPQLNLVASIVDNANARLPVVRRLLATEDSVEHSENVMRFVSDTEKCIDCEALPSVDRQAKCHSVIGFLQLRLLSKPDGISSLEKAAMLSADDPRHTINCIEALVGSGALDRALIFATESIKRFPKDPRITGWIRQIKKLQMSSLQERSSPG